MSTFSLKIFLKCAKIFPEKDSSLKFFIYLWDNLYILTASRHPIIAILYAEQGINDEKEINK